MIRISDALKNDYGCFALGFALVTWMGLVIRDAQLAGENSGLLWFGVVGGVGFFAIGVWGIVSKWRSNRVKGKS